MRRRERVTVTGGGTGIVNHVGTRAVADVGDEYGLSAALSEAMAPTRSRSGGWDRGEVLADLAVSLVDGGTRIRDLAVLRNQPDLFGEVASNPTAWRTLQAIDGAALERIAARRAQVRRRVWAAGMDPGFYVIDIDATLIDSHSDKEHAAPTYKRGFGFHPLMAYLDATGEALAGLLRPGNAGSGTATDHVTVLDQALAQLPVDPTQTQIIARTDSAGCSHVFLDACVERGVTFVVGHSLTAQIAATAMAQPASAWRPAVNADGSAEFDHAAVVELTDHIDLSGWPEGTRMIVRRELAHPGAQLTFTDIDGHRFCVCVTNDSDPDIAYLEALYRGRGRAERAICDAKDLGLARLPSASFPINQAWITLVAIAQDLLVWTQHLRIDPTDELASAEPKRFRYSLLHVAGLIARTGRRTYIRLSNDWPWTPTLIAMFQPRVPTPPPI